MGGHEGFDEKDGIWNTYWTLDRISIVGDDGERAFQSKWKEWAITARGQKSRTCIQHMLSLSVRE